MHVVVTGADGFVGRNLRVALMERAGVHIVPITRATTIGDLDCAIASADFVVHLAGVNRPQSPDEFAKGNADFTLAVCNAVREAGRSVPVLLSSSVQAELNNPYGASKHSAEEHVLALAAETGTPVAIYRLPNIFGKWARPNYNSAVATFCHNTARDLPLTVHDPAAALRLVYIDDVVREFIRRLDGEWPANGYSEVTPVYETTVGEVVQIIRAFRASRHSLITEPVGVGLLRALYSTYVSYMPTEEFAYAVPKYGDERGMFVEMLKTPDCGQFSFFTAHRGVTRGGHYHHSKTEKFLVIKGNARFRFRHVLSGESFELRTSGDEPKIVETVPGWAHDITNVGDTELVVMLWANEVFDRDRPDTYAHKV